MLFKFLCILGICSGFTRFASCFLLSGKSDVSEEWSQWTIINTHGDTCLRLRTRHCAKTSVNCTDKEFSAVCPVAPHWEEWSALQCSVQNGATCIIARARNCSVPTLQDCQSNEKNREIQVWGDMKTCPCREGNMKTTTESQLPTTTGVSRHANTDSNTVFTTASVRNPLNTTTSVPHWLEWSAWQCHNVDFGCIQSRWRHCSNSQYGCVGDHYELASCHQAGCTGHLTTDSSIGHVSSTDNSNKYPSWSGWGPWECHNELITCVMYRHRNCSDGYEVDCEKIGSKSYEMSQCDDSCKNSLVKATTTLLPDASMTSFPILRTSTQAPSFISVVTKTSFASFDQSSVVIPFTKSSVTTTSPITDIPIYWLEWTGWDCQETPVWCFMKNTRNCSTYNPGDCEDKLGGSHYEVHTCRTEICPAHWLEWGEWRCKMGKNGSCNMTRTRECSTGSTEACGLISSMSLPCERQVCPDKFELHQSGRCRGFNDTSCTDVPTCSIITDMHQLICQFKDTASKDCPKACGCCEEEAHWSEWSDWECQRLANYTCRMIRTRKCSTNDTNDCKGMSEVKAACSHSICQALPTHVSTILPNTIGSISTLTTELNGVGTKCKMFGTYFTYKTSIFILSKVIILHIKLQSLYLVK
ncbi:uncharacterized protein LOC123541812 isoform X3 [Mercenaria mercenaria]|uniref:uncharacterized protein LOC123541812 isoform X3 n=1 Tax=Mercenaria mercenaria TaxID=6596 RepID=UPI00234E794B|nr:uncharacterized protein LOC123541812 isoform X3 [Mercenaria mercenaria]